MADDESNQIQQRLHLILGQRHLRDAMRLLNDETHDGGLAENTRLVVDVFRRHLNTAVLRVLRDAGNDEQDLPRLAIQALWQALDLWNEQLQRLSSAATTAVVNSLEKQTFSATAGRGNDDDNDNDGSITECTICLVEFVDGGQISVMPCPSRGHRFHSDCITKWLETRNTCPLCRHQPPTTAGAHDQ